MPASTIRYHRRKVKYLNITQSSMNQDSEVYQTVFTKYKKLIGQIYESELKDKNQVKAIYSYTIPVVMHLAGIIKWTQIAIVDLITATKKLLTMHMIFATRLYPCSKDGDKGSGRINVKDVKKSDEQILRSHASSVASLDKFLT